MVHLIPISDAPASLKLDDMLSLASFGHIMRGAACLKQLMVAMPEGIPPNPTLVTLSRFASPCIHFRQLSHPRFLAAKTAHRQVRSPESA